MLGGLLQKTYQRSTMVYLDIFKLKRDKVLILGDGQLGSELFDHLSQLHRQISHVEILNKHNILIKHDISYDDVCEWLDPYVKNGKIKVIVNCIAYTKTSAAEKKDEGYIDAFYVNAIFPKYLAEYCAKNGVKLIHISTDYVSSEFGEEVPVNVYGTTKLLGEKNIQIAMANTVSQYAIIRTSWLYSLNHCNNFVYKFIKNCVESYKSENLFNEREVYVVENEISLPTHVTTLCKCILDVIANKSIYGTITCTDAPCSFGQDLYYEGISRYDFAKKILENCKYATYGSDIEKYFANIKLIPIKAEPFEEMNGKMSYPTDSTLPMNEYEDYDEKLMWVDMLEDEIVEKIDKIVKDLVD